MNFTPRIQPGQADCEYKNKAKSMRYNSLILLKFSYQFDFIMISECC
jgi:hypothetical protein